MLVTRVMQCRVRDKIEVKWQERVKEVKCFRYWRVGHCKQECPNIKVKKQKRKSEQAVHMVGPQKVQQKRRLAHPIWKKIQEYCNKESMPPEEIFLLEKGQIIEETVATYVEYGECKNKRVQIYENQKQEFLLKGQVKNIQYNLFQEA